MSDYQKEYLNLWPSYPLHTKFDINKKKTENKIRYQEFYSWLNSHL